MKKLCLLLPAILGALFAIIFVSLLFRPQNASAAVGTSTSASATAHPSQRKTFYDSVNSRHWAFYYDLANTSIAYRYSQDGTTWAGTGSLPYNTSNYSLTYKSIGGTGYIFVVMECNTYDICIRRGTIGAAAITFDAEQTVYNGDSPSNMYTNPTVALDTSKVWVAAKKSTLNKDYLAAARRSTNVATGDISLWDAATYQGIPQATLGDLIIVPQTGTNMLLICGNNSRNVVSWRFNGANWVEANAGGENSFLNFPGGGLSEIVRAMAVSGDNLYLGGSFTLARNASEQITVNRLARYNLTNNTYYQTGGGTYGLSNDVYTLAISGDNLYVGGQFATANNAGPTTLTVNRLTRCSIAASCDTFYTTGGGTYGLNSDVYALAISGDNLYIGGDFTSAYNPGPTTLTVNYLTRCSVAANCGTFYTTGGGSYGVGGGIGPHVWTLVTSGDNLFIGGKFSSAYNAGPTTLTVNSLTRCSIAANCDTFYTTGGGSYGVNGRVISLAVSGDNLYIGGNFPSVYNAGPTTLTVNNLTRCSIAANCNTFYTTGGGSFGVSGGFSPYVYVLAVSGDNLYIGGEFTSANNAGPTTLTVNRLTRCSIAASCDTFYTTGGGSYGFSGDSSTVNSLLAAGDNLYVGGYFTMANNAGPTTLPVNYLARCSIAANCDTFYSTSAGSFGVSGLVYAMAVSGDNLYIGGGFSDVVNPSGGLSTKYLTRYNLQQLSSG